MELTPEQRRAIEEINHHLQIIACAGSGKTEVITRRIKYILEQDADCSLENIVAFTFTEKAAASMKTRIAKAMSGYPDEYLTTMQVSTIHSFCYHLLIDNCPEYSEIRLLDTVKNHHFVARYNDICGMADLGLEPHPHGIKLFLDCISKMADDYIHRDEWEKRNLEAFEKYRACLLSHGFLDFSLLIFETLNAIDENPSIQSKLSSIKYLIVDEYQDVDDLQERLISRMARFGANVCVVGDDDQTIYQFRGSNASNMIGFADRYNDVVEIRLERNFRCTPAIVDVADCVIQNNLARLPKKMVSDSNDGQGNVRAIRYGSQDEEFQGLCSEMVRLHSEGIPYSEIAVLLRKGKYINPICSAMGRNGIPYSTDSAEYFFKGDYFKRFVSTLEILTNVNKASLFECWSGYIGAEELTAGFKYLRQVARSGGTATAFPLSGIIKEFLERTIFFSENVSDLQTRYESLEGITTILNDYDTVYGDYQLTARINGLLRFLENRAEDEYKYHSFGEKKDADAVQVMTVHKAKGLEFEAVILPEMEEREFPVGNMGGQQFWHILGGTFEANKSKYQSDLEDERKLFYVAVTRAKWELLICFQLTKNRVSTFVKEATASMAFQYDPRDFSFDDGGCSDQHQLAAKARHLVIDYYGTAMHSGMWAAGGDLVAVQQMSDARVIEEARRLGLL